MLNGLIQDRECHLELDAIGHLSADVGIEQFVSLF